MPIYEYQCEKCQEVSEVRQKFSDEPLQICPRCGGRVKKLMSLSSFSLKGKGWYVTDYKKKASGTETASSDAPKTESQNDSKTTPEKKGSEATSQSPVQKKSGVDQKAKTSSPASTTSSG